MSLQFCVRWYWLASTRHTAGLAASRVRRSALVTDNPMLLLQVKRLATEAGTVRQERYIDVRHTPDWERVATDWIEHGIEPPLPAEGPD